LKKTFWNVASVTRREGNKTLRAEPPESKAKLFGRMVNAKTARLCLMDAEGHGNPSEVPWNSLYVGGKRQKRRRG